ncbi:MAG: glycosyltransferase, partial [Armatimonadetes bacterium]|nr:glycosyltransferase [Armatimonadota bacterium]
PGRVAVIHRQGKLGYASAVRAGLRFCYDLGFEILITMDCDHSHDPSVVPVMLDKIRGADMVIGSRYVPGGGTVGWPWYRRLLSRAGGAIARALTGMTIRDPTGGFRAFRRDLLDRIGVWNTTAEGYGFLTETAFRAWLVGARIVEVPIIFRDRTRGKSKLSKRIILEAARLVLVLGWASRWPPARRRYLEEMER